ncbi:isoprenoid biosynthesis glyoxalase ElbB [Aliikangiella marina]|uniref:Glyoxalase n=1 Tax=Aliikangiella marina TaxID=1712262 RepID=A0A545T5D1_9GAMM|nr:isoprenoid biosynthesis glyoxalase ElbB [Aliikangiella marina]TQV72378.1 isoprenoid biosynthesis glyoxalase ElbB [Aliikangiella marina]
MANIAVVLSGCGVFDGAEIHESVLTLLALEENHADYQCFAPDMDQYHVLNHMTGEEMNETRNVMVEASRISRGNIQPITQLDAKDFDGLIFPGGFGAAKNLCNFAIKGSECEVQADVLAAAKTFVVANKPIGFICIAPAMIPLIYGETAKLTIGTDQETAAAINAMGGEHISCPVDEFIVDETKKVVSTPAYMLAGNVLEAASGIRKLVAKVLELS